MSSFSAYFEYPEKDSNQQVKLRYHPIKMDPEEAEGEGDEYKVQMKECLIERMPDGRGGLDQDRRECTRSLGHWSIDTHICTVWIKTYH